MNDRVGHARDMAEDRRVGGFRVDAIPAKPSSDAVNSVARDPRHGACAEAQPRDSRRPDADRNRTGEERLGQKVELAKISVAQSHARIHRPACSVSETITEFNTPDSRVRSCDSDKPSVGFAANRNIHPTRDILDF